GASVGGDGAVAVVGAWGGFLERAEQLVRALGAELGGGAAAPPTQILVGQFLNYDEGDVLLGARLEHVGQRSRGAFGTCPPVAVNLQDVWRPDEAASKIEGAQVLDHAVPVEVFDHLQRDVLASAS